MRRLPTGNEELAAVRSRASIGHGELSSLGMLNLEIFIRKFLSINRFPTGTIGIGKVSTLNHKVLNYAMEGRSLIMERLSRNSIALLSRAECSKVLSCFWSHISIQLHHNPPQTLLTLLHIKVHMRIVPLRIRYQQSLLIIVHANLPKNPTKRRLLLLLRLRILHLQFLNRPPHLLVLGIQPVRRHQVRLGTLQFARVHARQSPSVQDFDIGFFLLGRLKEDVVAAGYDVGPFLALDVTHGRISPAFDVQVLFVGGERFVDFVLVDEIGGVLVNFGGDGVISGGEFFGSLVFEFGCFFHAFFG
mmetsp:Transcript_898/g.1859  ORF Transcript_898/g.1859 Transcript_898/m.1859 type:complete len:303 (+) Transcript_898:284-1192(+)